jgi:hypothetical protein
LGRFLQTVSNFIVPIDIVWYIFETRFETKIFASDGQQFYHYQQNKERLNCDGQQFHQYQQIEQLLLT